MVLEGTVDSVAAKRLAPRLAAQVRGVKSVDDRLRVAPPSPMGDLEIADHIQPIPRLDWAGNLALV